MVVNKMKDEKSAIIAAILNFVSLGGGYLYLGVRKIFGWIMIVAVIIMSIEYLIGNLNHFTNLIDTHSYSLTIIAIAVAVDGYLLAKKIKNKK